MSALTNCPNSQNTVSSIPWPSAKLSVLYDMQETTVDLIEGAGYPAETHHVTTEDGYILAVHRYITQFSFSGDFLLKMFSLEYLNEGVHQCYTSMATSPRLPKLYSRTRALASSWPTRATTSGWSTSEATPTPGTTLWAPEPNHSQVLDPDNTNGPFWNFTWWEMGTMVGFELLVNEFLAPKKPPRTCRGWWSMWCPLPTPAAGVCWGLSDVSCFLEELFCTYHEKGINGTQRTDISCIERTILSENLWLSKTFGQAASGGALSGYECIVCDALKLSKLGGQDQPGWFSNF